MGNEPTDPKPGNAPDPRAPEAVLAALSQLADVLKAAQGQGNQKTIGEVIDLYLQERELLFQAGGRSAAGMYTDRFYLASFKAMFGARPVPVRGASEFVQWLVAHEEWRSPHTKVHAVGTVMRCFNFAEEVGLINRNPFRRPKRLWDTPKPRAAMTPAEFRAIIKAARDCRGRVRCRRCRTWRHACSRCRQQPSRSKKRSPTPPRPRHAHRRSGSRTFRLMLWSLWLTGARTCELREALWEDVDWEAGVLRLQRHKTTRTTGEDRVIALGRALRLVKLLWRQRQVRGSKDEHIFLNSRGLPWDKNQFARRFAEYRELAGVRKEVSGYSARHGFCVSGIENGLTERQIADALGQRTCKYIEWYGRTTRRKAGYLADVVARIRGRTGSEAKPPTEAPTVPQPEAAPAPPRPEAAIVLAVLRQAGGWLTRAEVLARLKAKGHTLHDHFVWELLVDLDRRGTVQADRDAWPHRFRAAAGSA